MSPVLALAVERARSARRRLERRRLGRVNGRALAEKRGVGSFRPADRWEARAR